jgi:hypothetical protein
MSMIGNFRRTSDARIDALLADPDSISDYLDGDPDEVADAGEAYADLDVDKAWHGIHFLLTGTAWEGAAPLSFIVRGGRPIGDVDVGYGPARAFSSADVRAIASAMHPIEPADLERRFDPPAMSRLDIYPGIWDRPREEDDTLGYLLENYAALKEFIEGAAKEGEGLLVYIA